MPVKDDRHTSHEVSMCFICLDLKEGLLSEYDADILAVELQNFISPKHSEELRQALKRAREKLTLKLDDYDYGYPLVYPSDND